MKILHALVGYLAATALPLHPFAFASLLAAIDNDGYVNTQEWQYHTGIDGALMNHFLGNIMEACQTVTIQKHTGSDNALEKPASGDIIEARQVPPLIIYTVEESLIIGVATVVALTIAWVMDDKSVRGNDHGDSEFKFLVEHFIKKFSARNVSNIPKALSPSSCTSLRVLTGLFATPHISPSLMGLRARTGVTPITN